MSQQAFCLREDIDIKRLIYWKRALIDRGLFTDRVHIAKTANPKDSTAKAIKEPQLLPVNIIPTEVNHTSILVTGQESSLYIQLNGKSRLVIPDNFNLHALAKE